MSDRTLEIVTDVPSPSEGIDRTVRVLVPPAGTTEPWGVLVLQDGQNVFDRAADVPVPWGVDTAFAALDHEGFADWLVVGVDHRGGERMGDYSPFRDRRLPIASRGDAYADFVGLSLLPWLAARYPISRDPRRVAIAGSSLGGLVALYTAWRFPQRIGRVGAFSPSVMWGDRLLFDRFSRKPDAFQRVYLDVGSRENFDAGWFTLDYGAAGRDFSAHLRSLEYGADELRFVLDPTGEHAEADWRRRFPSAARWLLG